jgi:predicted ATPase
VKASNFKSFKNLEIEFNDFDIVIGQNASGKSNLIQLLRFLRDIENYGLDNAISVQGGIEFLRNVNIGSSEEVSIEVTAAVTDEYSRPLFGFAQKREFWYKAKEFTYAFSLRTSPTGKRFAVTKDNMTIRLDITSERRSRTETLTELIGEAVVQYVHARGRATLKVVSSPSDEISQNLFLEGYTSERLSNNTLLVEGPNYYYFPFLPRTFFRQIAIFDIDPKLPKRGVPITAKAELEEDGSNLSIVLNRILDNRKTRTQLHSLIYDMLPFVEKLDVERFADKSMFFKLKETYFKKGFLPASLISDGTINISALLVALYFEGKPLTVIEEPERNLHPQLMSKLVNAIREAAKQRQIIITTHNPEIVKNVEPKEILLIGRDKEGFTTVIRPHESKTVQAFLDAGMRIDELFVQGTLGP